MIQSTSSYTAHRKKSTAATNRFGAAICRGGRASSFRTLEFVPNEDVPIQVNLVRAWRACKCLLQAGEECLEKNEAKLAIFKKSGNFVSLEKFENLKTSFWRKMDT